MQDTDRLKLLGSQNTEYKFDKPHAGMLESFPNPRPGRNYVVTHDTEEFTSLCPKTGQPDFANISIRFTPDKLCVESKSLKLYLFAYRSCGAFMERIVNDIMDDIVAATDPAAICVTGIFGARGGITTTVAASLRKKDYDPSTNA
jgi:7-cyano-7-deazaguanine reductase